MRRYFIGILIIVGYGGLCFAAKIPVGRPDTDLIYEYTRESYLRGNGQADNALFGQIDYKYLSEIFVQDSQDYKLTASLNAMSRRFDIGERVMNFQMTSNPDAILSKNNKKIYWKFFPQFGYQITSKIYTQIAYRIDSRLAHDPHYMGKQWQSFAGYAETALLGYRIGNLRLEAGRQRNVWGIAAGGQTLMLSAQAMPLDGVFADYRINRYLSIHSIVAFLSPLAEEPFTYGVREDYRYLSAHALRVSPANWLDIVFKESVVYGGLGRRLEPCYAQPLLWFHAEQLNGGNDDNTFLGLETIWRHKNKFAAYAELLLDDIQIEKKTNSDREPSQYGLIIGGDLFDIPLSQSYWEIEYSRVADWTYNQAFPRNRYINLNQAIGFPFGPDNESFRLGYNHHLSASAYWGIWYYQTKQGEGKLTNLWTAPWISNPNYAEKFPSGVVRNESGVGLRFIYNKDTRFQGKLTVIFADIKNDGNISGKNRDSWSMNGEIIFNFPNINWRVEHE
jgi:hypothetical protein